MTDPKPDFPDPNFVPLGPSPPPDDSARLIGLFLAGLLGGALVSAIVWFVAFAYLVNSSFEFLVWLVPLGKVLLGILLLCKRGWRGLGAGILVSIALGVLIFAGACTFTAMTHLH